MGVGKPKKPNEAEARQLQLDPGVVKAALAEACIDCAGHLEADRRDHEWQFCDSCGEAVCEACEPQHACAEFRAGRPKKWL
jgi:hypothetical protein